MTCYAIELYDKDNDLYEVVDVTGDFDYAIKVTRALSSLVHRDMIIDRFNDRVEPFDHVQIRISGTYNILMINEDLTDLGYSELDKDIITVTDKKFTSFVDEETDEEIQVLDEVKFTYNTFRVECYALDVEENDLYVIRVYPRYVKNDKIQLALIDIDSSMNINNVERYDDVSDEDIDNILREVEKHIIAF